MSSKNINNYGSTAETEDKVQTAGTTNIYKTNDLVSNGYKDFSNKCILRGAVIFCQHGFLGHDKTMLPLLEALESKTLKNDSYAYFCKEILDYNELSDFNLTLKDILDTHEKYPEKNIFVRTLFSNPIYGNVKTQASQLKEMINKVRAKYPTIPVALIGYSKGGVVNLKCAIDNPGLIDKVVNIGTPHDDTLVQDLIQIIGNGLKEKFPDWGLISFKPARDAIQYLVNNVNEIEDKIMDGTIIYKNLKSEWNELTNKPKFTPIAGEAIVINGEFNGDFIVPTESAMAEGFRGRTYLSRLNDFKVDSDRLTITTSKLRDAMGNCDVILDVLGAFSKYIIGKDIVKIIECLIDIVANIIQNGDNIVDCFKLAHLDIFGTQKFILTHDEILYHVVEGLNA